MQIKRVDRNKMFTPIIKLTSLWTLLALAVEINLEIYQLDIKMAYLNSVLNRKLYLEPLKGFKPTDTTIVWRLNHLLYGFK